MKSLLINTVQCRTTKLSDKHHLFEFACSLKERLEFPKYQYSLFDVSFALHENINEWRKKRYPQKFQHTRVVRKRFVEFEAKSLMS